MHFILSVNYMIVYAKQTKVELCDFEQGQLYN